MVQIQPVPIDIFLQMIFFLFIYGVLQGDNFLAGYFYMFYLFISIRDSLRIRSLFLQLKNTDEFTGSLTRFQYPKCEYGPYCKIHPIKNGVYIWVEVSIYITSHKYEYLEKVRSIRSLRMHDIIWFIRNIGTRFWSLRRIFPIYIWLHVL